MSLDLIGGLVILGAVLGLDGVSVGQTMLSRPLVASTLAGLMCGAPVPALAAGVLLECIALETLPVGASRYPEWASAGVTAGAMAAQAPGGKAGAITIALLGGLLVAWIGGRSLVVLRHWNGRQLAAVRPRLDAGDATALTQLTFIGIAGDLGRGALVTAVGVLMMPVVPLVLPYWQAEGSSSAALTAGAATMVTAAAARQMFHAAPGTRWLFLVAVISGALLVVALP